MKAKKFEQQFDEGVDITAYLDLSKGKRVLQEQKAYRLQKVRPVAPGVRDW